MLPTEGTANPTHDTGNAEANRAFTGLVSNR
jgi:hypothetical protein